MIEPPRFSDDEIQAAREVLERLDAKNFTALAEYASSGFPDDGRCHRVGGAKLTFGNGPDEDPTR